MCALPAGGAASWPLPPHPVTLSSPAAAPLASLRMEPLSLKQAARGYDWRAEPAVPSFVMDPAETTRPLLPPPLQELLAHERLDVFAEAMPAPPPGSEPGLPPLLAAPPQRLAPALVLLLPDHN